MIRAQKSESIGLGGWGVGHLALHSTDGMARSRRLSPFGAPCCRVAPLPLCAAAAEAPQQQLQHSGSSSSSSISSSISSSVLEKGRKLARKLAAGHVSSSLTPSAAQELSLSLSLSPAPPLYDTTWKTQKHVLPPARLALSDASWSSSRSHKEIGATAARLSDTALRTETNSTISAGGGTDEDARVRTRVNGNTYEGTHTSKSPGTSFGMLSAASSPHSGIACL